MPPNPPKPTSAPGPGPGRHPKQCGDPLRPFTHTGRETAGDAGRVQARQPDPAKKPVVPSSQPGRRGGIRRGLRH